MHEATGSVGLYVGLDWADKEHVAYVREPGAAGGVLERVRQRPEELHAWIQELRIRSGGRRVAIGIEQSRGPVIWALMEYEFLDIYPINPLALHRFAEARRVSGAKDDAMDAELAETMISSHADWLHPLQPDTEQTRRIRLMTEIRRKLVDQRTAVTNELTAALKQYYPQALACGGGMETALFGAFLRTYPTFEILSRETPEGVRAFYSKHRCRARKVIDERLAMVRRSRALTSDPAVIDSYRVLAEACLAILTPLNESIAKLNVTIESAWREHPERQLFESLPGAGPNLAPRLCAVFGEDRERWSDARSLQQLSGIAPVRKQSGPIQTIGLRWNCSKFVRQTFHEFAAHSIRKSEWASIFYKRARNRGMKHHAAVRALAFRWIRVLFRCWMTRTPYDEAVYLEALKKSGSPLAAV